MDISKIILPKIWACFVILNILLCGFWFWWNDVGMALWHIAMGFLCHMGYVRAKSHDES